MPFIILGIGVGCWMYSFVNHRWNDNPWISSAPLFWLGLIAIITGTFLTVNS
jgi:hypothetical protein